MVVRAFAKTDVGRVREHNEDAHFVSQEFQVFVVADGMGGHAGGAQASALAVQTISEHLHKAGGMLLDDKLAALELEALTKSSLSGTPIDVLTDEAQVPPDGSVATAAAVPYVVYDVWDPGIAATSIAPVINRMLADGVRLACRTIFEAAGNDATLMGMGTTTTVLCLHKDWAYVAHVGDSRCYMQRDNALMQVTEDHSLVNEQIKAGLLTADEARVSRHKNIITRSVGFEPDVEVDCFMMPTRPGDQFLMCSDGLSNLIEDEELAESMEHLRGQSLLDFLVELALGRGGDDNITVIGVELVAEVP